MNEGQALRDAEIALRDFISLELEKKHGEQWPIKCRLTSQRIEGWKAKREEEQKKFVTGLTEDRLIYFAEFHDLLIIIEKNWDAVFKPVFDDLKEFRILFNLLLSFRNPHAHHRELLTFQKHLIVGISGYFRGQIVKFRSKMETGEDVFPRIESVNDNYGNIWTPGVGAVIAQEVLRPGDDLEFMVKGTDPKGESLEYGLHPNPNWQKDNRIKIRIGTEHINNPKMFVIVIRSIRDYHADGNYDGAVSFSYKIFPEVIKK
tara:strand:+ start:1160 stop:1939 length:780 start_codon:yes stop_codon:yes gene_type:complete